MDIVTVLYATPPVSVFIRPARQRGNTRFRKSRIFANCPPRKCRSRLAATRRVVLLGPFGEPLVSNGVVAAELPFRFSTKYQDAETGLYYYSHHYYGTGTGRWLSRDPIEEEGGVNLYAFLNNDALNFTDALGLRGLLRNPLTDLRHDDQGLALLGGWLYGKGADQIIKTEDSQWHTYMTAKNEDTAQFRLDVKMRLQKVERDTEKLSLGTATTVDETMRGEFLNGEDMIGYHYLHTSNPVVGDFHIKGTATKTKCGVDMDLEYIWNDIIGPNKNYGSDTFKARIGRGLSFGNAENYRLEIHFEEKMSYEKGNGTVKREGWPWK